MKFNKMDQYKAVREVEKKSKLFFNSLTNQKSMLSIYIYSPFTLMPIHKIQNHKLPSKVSFLTLVCCDYLSHQHGKVYSTSL